MSFSSGPSGPTACGALPHPSPPWPCPSPRRLPPLDSLQASLAAVRSAFSGSFPLPATPPSPPLAPRLPASLSLAPHLSFPREGARASSPAGPLAEPLQSSVPPLQGSGVRWAVLAGHRAGVWRWTWILALVTEHEAGRLAPELQAGRLCGLLHSSASLGLSASSAWLALAAMRRRLGTAGTKVARTLSEKPGSRPARSFH